jgi:hypothetical protein
MDVIWIVPIKEITQVELQTHICSMLTSCFQKDDHPIENPPCIYPFEEDSTEYCALYITNCPYTVDTVGQYIIELLPQISGCCMIRPNEDNPREMNICNVCSLDRGKGNTKRLMEKVLAWCFSHSTVTVVSIDVYLYNSYIILVSQFYLRLGFRFRYVTNNAKVFHYEITHPTITIPSTRTFESILVQALHTIYYQLSTISSFEEIRELKQSRQRIHTLLENISK